MTDSARPLDFWARSRLIRSAILTPQQKWLLRIIADYAGDTGDCWAAIGTLARDFGASRRYVQTIRSQLIATGLISVSERPGESSLTAINWRLLESIQSNEGVGSIDHPPVNENSPDPGSIDHPPHEP